jgi:hypothetical protein
MAYRDFDIEIVRGDTCRFRATLTVRDEEGEVVADADISNWTFYFTAKSDRRKADSAAEIQVTSAGDSITVPDSGETVAIIKLTPTDYARCEIGRDYRLYCDLQGTNPETGGDKVTLATGMLDIVYDATRS